MYKKILSHLCRLIQKVNLFIAVAISMVEYIAIMVFQIAKSFSCGSNNKKFKMCTFIIYDNLKSVVGLIFKTDLFCRLRART